MPYREFRFSKMTPPKLPYKRQLTSDEKLFLSSNFKYNYFSDIDANNRIIFGVESTESGLFYITEKDLSMWMRNSYRCSYKTTLCRGNGQYYVTGEGRIYPMNCYTCEVDWLDDDYSYEGERCASCIIKGIATKWKWKIGNMEDSVKDNLCLGGGI